MAMDYVRSFVSCCLSACALEENDITGNEPNERTHLLANDPVPSVRRPNNDTNEYPNSLAKNVDEVNALSRIVAETATNIIDVTAMDSHNLETQEYNDRIKLYNYRLAQQWNTVSHPQFDYNGLLRDIPNAEQILSAPPISAQEFNMIKRIVKSADMAVANIKIEHKEALVVPFQIPS